MSDVTRQVCAWLTDPRPEGEPSEAVMAAARGEGVHLVIADRCRVPGFAAELRAAAVVEEIRARELRRVLAALADAGVEAVLLKGVALARTIYPRPELRLRSDTDLMVPAAARGSVSRVLPPLQYRQADEVDGEFAVGQFHFLKVDDHGIDHALDVHWRVSNVRVFADALSYDELRRAARSIPELGPHAWGPSPEHALLLACVHRVAHHDDSRYLLWLLDVHLLAQRLTAHQQTAFARLAKERQMRAVCAGTLDLSQEAFGALDRGWLDELSASGDGREPSRAFIGGGLRPAEILLTDVAATEAWSERLRLLREHLFPRLSYIRARYPRWPAVLLPAAYVHRVVRGLPRWLRRG